MIGSRTFNSGCTMDRVSENLLNEFSSEHGITNLKEDKRFEHFSAYITTQRHFPQTFDSGEIVIGSGGDTGIDAISILVNGHLITDIETLNEHLEIPGDLDVTFIFIQAERSAGFDAAKIGNFGFGVMDFFRETPTMTRRGRIVDFAEIQTALYQKSTRFRRGNPVCRLYYVTTGKWLNDPTLVTRMEAVKSDLEGTGLFREVDFVPVDAAHLQKLYRLSQNSIGREFIFNTKTTLPEMPEVEEAHLGFLPAPDFLKIIRDETGELVPGLFNDNVRDWLDSNPVNDEIRATLESPFRSRFALMNNGITIIARGMRTTGQKIFIEDFSIVNGCQTSHAIHQAGDKIDSSVMVPIRLIVTQNEDVINQIIIATNRQTAVLPEQFYALEEFSKSLEEYFRTFPENHRLYYERRTRQFHRLSIEKTRIVTPTNMIRSYAAMFLSEPHRTTRAYGSLKAKIGKEIFTKGDKMEPYYVAAFLLYRVEYFFRSGKLVAASKPARYHILYAARLLISQDKLPFFNSKDMAKLCDKIMKRLWDGALCEELILIAAEAVATAALGDYQRDTIRTEPFTIKVRAEVKKLPANSITAIPD